ncbi:MAG: DUF4031 domain-containing protein [Actinomycetes bacterium]
MTVYVDPPLPPPTVGCFVPGWPLLRCNGPVEELHDFARSIGVGPGWFSAEPEPSYALTEDARARAVRAGARPALALVSGRRSRPAEAQTKRRRQGLRATG